MNRTKLPIRKRLENVPQFSGSVDAAVAEVGATNRLGSKRRAGELAVANTKLSKQVGEMEVERGYRTNSKLKSIREHSGKFSTRYTVVVM
ncbi:hypothetical protein AgCh_013777 [Apium graveolens]